MIFFLINVIWLEINVKKASKNKHLPIWSRVSTCVQCTQGGGAMGTQLSPGIIEINGFQWVSGLKECLLTSPSPLLEQNDCTPSNKKKISGFFYRILQFTPYILYNPYYHLILIRIMNFDVFFYLCY